MNKEEYEQGQNNKRNGNQHNLEEKLEDLLKMGWIMLPESCTSPSCNCPLMQSSNGDKYCAGCEAWHFEHQRPKKQNFQELGIVKKDTDLQLKETSLDNQQRKKSFGFVLHQSVIRCLQTKLYFLTTLLNNENDVSKIKELLDLINTCLENIRLAVCLEQY